MALGGFFPLTFERGLSARVIISVAIATVLLPTLLVAGWLARVSANAERAQIERNIQQRAHEISAILDREVTGISGMLTALAMSTSLASEDLQSFHAKASEISQRLNLNVVLYDIAKNHAALTTAAPFGAPLQRLTFPRRLVDRVLASESPFVTGVTQSPVTGRYMVGVVIPVRAGQTEYLLAGAIDVSRIVSVFRLVGLQLPFVATVTDRNGAIVARSDKHEQFVGRAVPQSELQARDRHGTLATQNMEGVGFRWVYERSPTSKWTVLVGAPEAVFNAPLHSALQLLAMAALVLLAGGFALAYRIGGRFSQAASELRTVARELPHHPPPLKVLSKIREANELLDDLKAAAADLRAADDQQRFAIEAAGIGTWNWDIKQDRIVWSQRTREFYQLPPDAEPSREYFTRRIHPDDRAMVLENLQRCLHGAVDSYQIEFRVLGVDGRSVKWIHSQGCVMRDASGAAIFMHGALTDVTERKASEEERSDLRRRLMSAQEQERLRLAHELHDQTGQSLTAALLSLKQVSAAVGSERNVHVQRLRQQLEDMGKTVHRIARELRPTAIEDLGLRAALANHLSEWGAEFGIPCDLHFRSANADDPGLIPGEVATALYRIVQEGLTNVAKHATGATAVSVIINCSGEFVQLTLEDNGCGFDVSEASRRGKYAGLGLAGMRERAALVGGTLEIESSPAAGTTIFVRVPLEKRRQVA